MHIVMHMDQTPTPTQIWIARAVGLAADALQVVLFPFFAEGFASPANVAVDLIVAAVLTKLIGWHIAFVPSFIVEMMPVADLAPTWSLAVWIATRGRTADSIPAGEPIRVEVSRRD
jgi:cellulose synthase/poly-beta-1,6-N-acetylglucosamine synthase-like glycosyltransferase